MLDDRYRSISGERAKRDQWQVSGAACRKTDLKHVFADDGTRPYTAQDVVLCDQFIGRLNQELNDFERASSDWYRGDRPPFRRPGSPIRGIFSSGFPTEIVARH
jgi:hypothetical protein